MTKENNICSRAVVMFFILCSTLFLTLEAQSQNQINGIELSEFNKLSTSEKIEHINQESQRLNETILELAKKGKYVPKATAPTTPNVANTNIPSVNDKCKFETAKSDPSLYPNEPLIHTHPTTGESVSRTELINYIKGEIDNIRGEICRRTEEKVNDVIAEEFQGIELPSNCKYEVERITRPFLYAPELPSHTHPVTGEAISETQLKEYIVKEIARTQEAICVLLKKRASRNFASTYVPVSPNVHVPTIVTTETEVYEGVKDMKGSDKQNVNQNKSISKKDRPTTKEKKDPISKKKGFLSKKKKMMSDKDDKEKEEEKDEDSSKLFFSIQIIIIAITMILAVSGLIWARRRSEY